MPDHQSSLLPPLVPPAVHSDGPGWAMGPSNGHAVGLDARGSWLLEPETGTGMLLYPRDWTFAERCAVATHLRDTGWSIVPTRRFLHLTSDGETVIRLLSQSGGAALEGDGGRLIQLPAPSAEADQREASH